MDEAVRIFERDVKLFIPWNAPRPEFRCKPYSITMDKKLKPIQDSEGQEHTHFFVIQLRCPLGTQNFAVLALPADSDLYDFDNPVDFDVHGWVEHAMCGSCLCKPAQLLMDARRRNKPEKFKQDWMFFEVHAGTPIIQRPSQTTEDLLNGGDNPREGSEVSRESSDYVMLDASDPNSWRVLCKNVSVPTGDDNGKQG